MKLLNRRGPVRAMGRRNSNTSSGTARDSGTVWETRSPRRGSIGGLSRTTTTCLSRVSTLPPSHRPMDMTRRPRHPLLALGPPSSTAGLLDRCPGSSPTPPVLIPTTTRWTSRPGYRRRAVSTTGSNRWSHRQRNQAACARLSTVALTASVSDRLPMKEEYATRFQPAFHTFSTCVPCSSRAGVQVASDAG